jgi:hypothetical protein
MADEREPEPRTPEPNTTDGEPGDLYIVVPLSDDGDDDATPPPDMATMRQVGHTAAAVGITDLLIRARQAKDVDTKDDLLLKALRLLGVSIEEP